MLKMLGEECNLRTEDVRAHEGSEDVLGEELSKLFLRSGATCRSRVWLQLFIAKRVEMDAALALAWLQLGGCEVEAWHW